MDPVVEARALAVLRAGMHPDLLKALAGMNGGRPTATIVERIRKCSDNLQVLDILIEHGAIADVGEPFSFKGREHWRPIARDMGGDRCVVMSSAQVGKTINVVYANYICGLRDALEGRPSWVGFYLPVQQMVIDFAKGRFDPILHKMREIVGGHDDDGRKSIENLPPAIRARAKAFMREAAGRALACSLTATPSLACSLTRCASSSRIVWIASKSASRASPRAAPSSGQARQVSRGMPSRFAGKSPPRTAGTTTAPVRMGSSSRTCGLAA